jgi:hypothetical protein
MSDNITEEIKEMFNEFYNHECNGQTKSFI